MYNIIKHKLHFPSLDEVAKLLHQELRKHFDFVNVEVVDCPNLTKEPFNLAAEGLSGKPTLANAGGVPYVIPLALKDKCYNLKYIAEKLDIPDAFIIGAGAGPRHHVGTNCEMMANVKFGEMDIINTHIAKINEDGDYLVEKLIGSTDFCLLGTLFASEGKSGPVIKVHTKKRTSTENFVSAMRGILSAHYGDKPIGLGGVFLLSSGKARLHVMPDYSETPLKTLEDINNWLKFFNMTAPLICLSTFVSHDLGITGDFIAEHTHCFSNHGEGGHYHEDTTPEEVEYLGYFNIAEFIFRIDPPPTKLTLQ